MSAEQQLNSNGIEIIYTSRDELFEYSIAKLGLDIPFFLKYREPKGGVDISIRLKENSHFHRWVASGWANYGTIKRLFLKKFPIVTKGGIATFEEELIVNDVYYLLSILWFPGKNLIPSDMFNLGNPTAAYRKLPQRRIIHGHNSDLPTLTLQLT